MWEKFKPVYTRVYICWSGKNSSLSPLEHVVKLLKEYGRQWASNQCTGNNQCPVGLLQCYCYLLQNLRIKPETKNSQCQLQKVGEGVKFKYPQSFPVFAVKLCKLLLPCLLLAAGDIEPCHHQRWDCGIRNLWGKNSFVTV